MRFDEEYRGYKIRYRRRRVWVANIWPPNASFWLQEFPVATMEEGRAVLEERARALVDAHISTAKGCPPRT